jgi:DNA-directed RNA polymerase subunit RPC12/RpoP
MWIQVPLGSLKIKRKIVGSILYEKDESVAIKNKIAENNGFVVRVLRKNNLQEEFKWVKQCYNVKNFEKLYDYKPKYKYVCSYCGEKFFRDKKSKTEKVFCCRHCVGKSSTSHPTMDKELIVELLEKGCTMPQIAARVGKSNQSVYNFLKKHELKTKIAMKRSHAYS